MGRIVEMDEIVLARIVFAWFARLDGDVGYRGYRGYPGYYFHILYTQVVE